MCLSQLRRVVAPPEDGMVLVDDEEGRRHRVSLLAYGGPPPEIGGWLLVHSGYALSPMDDEEAAAVLASLRSARGDGGSRS